MRIASEKKQFAADSEITERPKDYAEFKAAAMTALSTNGIHPSATAGMALPELNSSQVKY